MLPWVTVVLTTPQSSLFGKQMIGHGMTRCHFLVGDVGLQGVLGEGGRGGWKMGSDLTAHGRAQINLHSWWITSNQGLVFQEMRRQRWVLQMYWLLCKRGEKTCHSHKQIENLFFLATKGLDVELKMSKVNLYGRLDEWLLFNLNWFGKAVAEVQRCPVRLRCGAPCWAEAEEIDNPAYQGSELISLTFFLGPEWFSFNCNVQVFLSLALWTTAGKLCRNEKHWR